MVAEFVSSDESLACDEYEQTVEYLKYLQQAFALAFEEYYHHPLDRASMVPDSQWNCEDWLKSEIESFEDHSAREWFSQSDR